MAHCCIQSDDKGLFLNCASNCTDRTGLDCREGLWEPAEVLHESGSGHRVVFCKTGVDYDVDTADIVKSAYVTDSDADSQVCLG